MNDKQVKFLTPGSKCPSCTTYLLVHHCGNCEWLKCSDTNKCRSLFDVATGRYSIKEKV